MSTEVRYVNGKLDEVVITNVESVHLEYMDRDELWIGIYINGKEFPAHVNIGSTGEIETYVSDENDREFPFRKE